jgi:hypothetical protein
MFKSRFKTCHLVLIAGWLIAAILISLSMARSEGSLEDPNTLKLLNDAIRRKQIVIAQSRPGLPLEVIDPKPFDKVEPPDDAAIIFNRTQWERALQLARQFKSAANWGLAEPFDYEEQGGVYRVKSILSEGFKYQNPFAATKTRLLDTPVVSSHKERPAGWLIVSRDLVLLLRPNAVTNELTVGSFSEEPEGVHTARQFIIQSPNRTRLRLSLSSNAEIAVQPLNAQGEAQDSYAKTNGEHFLWNGISFVILPAGDQGATRLNGDIIFSKRINGQLARVHVLGEATTNLLGAQARGQTPFLDKAIRQDMVREVSLTIDFSLQAGAYIYLRKALEPLGIHPLGRSRRGAVSVLDVDTGAVLAHVGYPSFDPIRAQSRRVILDRDALARNPANEIHMAGSTIKVLTVAAGYLLYGNAHAELLPPSNPDLAVRQAFVDAYGSELNAPLGQKATVTEEATKEFNNEGTANRVRPEFLDLLNRVFLVSPNICNDCPEQIVSANLQSYFNADRLVGLYPAGSRFPILWANSMGRLRNIALGAEEGRFTTLRLASVLGTAVRGRVYRPFMIESVKDNDNRVIEASSPAVTDVDLQWGELAHRRVSMIGGMRNALHRVLLPGGTGYFFVQTGNGLVREYLGQSPNRENDYGKSGTADYDEGRFQDSLFVYLHGRYLIAIWLERADGSELVEQDPAEQPHRPFERHPAHLLTHRIIQLIDALDGR